MNRLWRALETGAAIALGLMAALVIYQVGGPLPVRQSPELD